MRTVMGPTNRAVGTHSTSASAERMGRMNPMLATRTMVDSVATPLSDVPSSPLHSHALDDCDEDIFDTKRVARPVGPPRTAADLFTPLSTAAKDLPEWFQGYLSLLADSSTSNGSMQRHLMKMCARGIADTHKVVQLVTDPLDGVSDMVAEQGKDLVMKQLTRLPGSRGSLQRPSDDGMGEATHSGAGVNQLGPVQGKVLSVMMSLLMSGLASGAAANAAEQFQSLQSMGHTTEVVQQHTTGTSATADDASFFQAKSHDSVRGAKGAPSFAFNAHAAPSVIAGVSFVGGMSFMQRGAPSMVASSGASSLLGAGGMATSTALKMLRADSKMKAPDLGNILDAILDSVSEDSHHITMNTVKESALEAERRLGKATAA